MVLFYIFLLVIIILILTYILKKNDMFSGEISHPFFKDPEQNSLNFLWSRGLTKKNMYTMVNENRVRKKLILNQLEEDIVWIRTTGKAKEEYCDLDYFSESLENIKNDIILVTSDGIKSIPSDLKKSTFDKIINCPKIKRWYTQNYDGTVQHEKLKNYPIGFDLHTTRSFFGIPLKILPSQPASSKINYLLQIRKKLNQKYNKIFVDVHLNQHNIFNNERKRVKDILYNSQNCNFLNRGVDQKSIWKKYSEHKFVISAFGMGLDCHRTWECLFLGAIVIVKKSSLDPLYKNLPVVILDDWDECLDSKNLERWEKEYGHLTQYEHLNKFFTYDYWIKQ